MRAKRLYDDDMYRFDQPQASYWEASATRVELRARPLAANTSCEVAIIGGGYTGLSAAYHLAKHHDIEARVLDAGHIGWGASGRNGGFCSIGGSSLSLARMIRKYGQNSVREYYRSQVEAVELVRNIIRDEHIDAEVVGDAELELAHSRRAFRELREHTEMQSRLLGLDADVVTADEFRERYFDCTEQFGAARLRPTFALHPLRYHLGLAAAAENAGAILHNDSEVVSWTRDGDRQVLNTKAATIRARFVIMAANGFMPECLNRRFFAQALPMISAIVVTRPLSDSELSAHQYRSMSPAITDRNLMNYFRLLPDRRFLFGGRGSSSGRDDVAAKTYDGLVARLRQLCPAWKDVQIDYRWHGLICFTRRQTPAIGRLSDDPGVFFAFGYHGNGVNTSTWAGKHLAQWLANRRYDDRSIPGSLPLIVRGMSGRFPLPALRRHYLQARLALFRIADGLH